MKTNFFKRAINRVRRKFILEKFRKKNNNKDVTLISQNCVGGVMYADLGLRFMSPTINMFIEDEFFVKLVENLDYYMSVEAKPYIENYIDPIDPSIHYPKIIIDDVVICCLHYHSCAEAVETWERRRKRVNLKNVRVLATSWNLHNNAELVKRIMNTKYKTVIFSTYDMGFKECIKLEGDVWSIDNRGIVRPNITDYIPGTPYRYFEKLFDFVEFVNK